MPASLRLVSGPSYLYADRSRAFQSMQSMDTIFINLFLLSVRWLCLTNLFCWSSLVCYSLYFTDFVGQAVFGGDPQVSHFQNLYPYLNQHRHVNIYSYLSAMKISIVNITIHHATISWPIAIKFAKSNMAASQFLNSCGPFVCSGC